ncbi:unnamed protein product [Brassicogethes aeneus]|uniref:Uncharacterized protein n=1 Tax=Brassicogethes aeneus TaxID=1431903 RepID=A0A9P0B3X2_BRAAE|nr:unnamed protein product [Brassicogethes aeneus]
MTDSITIIDRLHPKISETFRSVEEIFQNQVNDIKSQYKTQFALKAEELDNYFELKPELVKLHKEVISIINGRYKKAENIIETSTEELKQLIHEYIPEYHDLVDTYLDEELKNCKEVMSKLVREIKEEINDFAYACIEKVVFG